MKNILVIIITIAFGGCASLSEEGRQVRFASQVGQDCKFLGSIDGSVWINNGDNHLKNEAAKMGGNWVVVTDYRWEGVFTGSKPSTGEVYKCPELSGSARVVDKKIDVNVKTFNEKSNSDSEDTFYKLKKLKELYDKGVINSDEYENKKKSLLENL